MEKLDLRYGKYENLESLMLTSALGIVLADQLDMDVIPYYKGPRDARIAAIESAKRLDYYYKVVKPFILDFTAQRNIHAAILVYGSTGAGTCSINSDIDLRVLYGTYDESENSSEVDARFEQILNMYLPTDSNLMHVFQHADLDYQVHICSAFTTYQQVEALRSTNMDRGSFTEGDNINDYLARLIAEQNKGA